MSIFSRNTIVPVSAFVFALLAVFALFAFFAAPMTLGTGAVVLIVGIVPGLVLLNVCMKRAPVVARVRRQVDTSPAKL